MIKLVEWFTKQRLVVNWSGDIKNHIKYEVGDQVILNDSDLIPTGINNSSKFMIIGKRINIIKSSPYVQFQLLELG